MGIDWFTLVAQIVNFVILLVLLRAFLFRPVQRYMDAREQRIADEHEAAQQARAEAERHRDELEREREELQARRRERLAEIEREAEETREERLAEVREEAEAAQADWRDDLQRQRGQLEAGLRRAMVALLADALQRGWRELADEALEARAIEAFAERVGDLDDDTRAALSEAARSAPLRFLTAFEPDQGQRDAMLGAVRNVLEGAADLEPEFERDPDLIAGVTLRAGDVRVGWSARAHVEDLERAWAEALSEELRGAPGGGEGERDDGDAADDRDVPEPDADDRDVPEADADDRREAAR